MAHNEALEQKLSDLNWRINGPHTILEGNGGIKPPFEWGPEVLPPDDSLFGDEHPWTIAHAEQIAKSDAERIAIEGLKYEYDMYRYHSAKDERERKPLEQFINESMLRRSGIRPSPGKMPKNRDHPFSDAQRPLEFDKAGEYYPDNSEIKVIITDSDDTFVHETGKVWLNGHQQVFQSGYDVHVPDDLVLKGFGDVRVVKNLIGVEKFIAAKPDKFKDADGNMLSDDEIADIVFKEITDVVMKDLANIKIDPDVIDAAREWRAKGGLIAVISNSPREVLERVYENNGVSGLFDIVLSAEDSFDENGIKRSKPDRYTGDKVLARCGELLGLDGPLPAQNAVVVGDAMDKDVGLGKSLGAHTVYFSHPLHRDLRNKKLRLGLEERHKALDAAKTYDERVKAYAELRDYEIQQRPTKIIKAYDDSDLTLRSPYAKDALKDHIRQQDSWGLSDSKFDAQFIAEHSEQYEQFKKRGAVAKGLAEFFRNTDAFRTDIRGYYGAVMRAQYGVKTSRHYYSQYRNDMYKKSLQRHDEKAA